MVLFGSQIVGFISVFLPLYSLNSLEDQGTVESFQNTLNLVHGGSLRFHGRLIKFGPVEKLNYYCSGIYHWTMGISFCGHLLYEIYYNSIYKVTVIRLQFSVIHPF